MAILHSSLITTRAQLETAFREIAKFPYGYMLKVSNPTRTDLQNKMMWPLLAEFEKQGATINGKEHRDHQWKSIFLEALGHEQEFLPSLDGSRWFAAGLRSSTLGTKEFSDLIEMILAEAAERGVIIKNPKEDAADETEGGKGSQPAPEPPSVRELPTHPGELIRTREGAMEYARRWAAFYLTLPTDKQDDFIVETEALINLAKSLNPDSYPVFKETVNPSKGKAA